MRVFLKDETGSTSVEIVIWFSFLLAMSMTFGQQVVGPLVAQAQRQAELNEASLEVIKKATATCAMAVTP